MEIDKMCPEIEKAVKQYSKEVEASIVVELDRTADEIISYLKSNTPRGNSSQHLADSFVKETFGSGANKTIVIFSKTKSGLVHLVEFGFRHRSGKMIAARPFMRPAYDSITPGMLEDIKKIIERGG